MRILVAGGAGYIGSILVPLLLERGHEVVVLDRLYFGDTLAAPQRRYGERLRVVRADTRSFDPALLKGVEACCDIAGISNDPSCELEPGLTEGVNVHGGTRLARLAAEAGVRRYVYSSSCSVYGHGAERGLTEDSPRNPVSLYAKSKVAMEDELASLASRVAGFETVVLRLATVFGLSPRMRFDLAVNVMTKNAYVARRVMVEGGGRQWRPFVHVRDVAQAFTTALERPAAEVAGKRFNVGSDRENTQILPLAFRVRDVVPGTEIVLTGTDPDLRDYNVSFATIERELGFRTSHTIDDGIREVLEALKSGAVDPDERRWYTLRQYLFLREAEKVCSELSIGGGVLSA